MKASVVLLLLGWLIACVAPPTIDEPVTGDRQSRASIKKDLATFVTENSAEPKAEEAALKLARLHLDDREPELAFRWLTWILRERPNGTRNSEARLLLAGVHESRGDSDSAYQILSGVRFSDFDLEEEESLRLRLAGLAAKKRDHVAQLNWLSGIRAGLAGEEEGESNTRIIEAIAAIDPDALGPVARQLGQSFPASLVWLREAELAEELGDPVRAERALLRAKALALIPGEAERFLDFKNRIREGFLIGSVIGEMPLPSNARLLPTVDTTALQGSVGVVLPLSGPFADFGRSSLDGILLAAGIFDANASGAQNGITLEIRDSQGSPELAAQFVSELAADETIHAIVGPLLGDETAAVVPVVRRAGIPLLALSRREEAASRETRILRFGQTPRAEVELLADYAVRGLGLNRFALLYPRDDYGRRTRALFWRAVEARGAKVVGVASYAPNSTDFAEAVRSLIGFQLTTAEDRELLVERRRLLDEAKRLPSESAAVLREEAKMIMGVDGHPLPPFVDFEALFIPDTHEVVALMAPQLAFHEISGVRLLGLSEWHHPDLLSIGREHVDGAVFTASFFENSQVPFIFQFTRRFRNVFNRMPDAFAAQAFDAATLLLWALSGSPVDRGGLLARLLDIPVSAGVSGVIKILSDGNAAKRPHLLGVDRGRIVSVDETGEPPYLKLPVPEDEECIPEEL